RTYLCEYHAVQGKQLIKKLQALGVEIETGRGKGGHVQARFNGKKTVIKTHGAQDLSNNYVNLVCKQLGINPEDL
ncbi:MAG: addiction module toxin, HicA family, partial [Proteobacteria bacterium]|nr:addiction module toxin, HicA family [Pseudomonadota bacterium]